MSIDNISFISSTSSSDDNKSNKENHQSNDLLQQNNGSMENINLRKHDDEPENIIPWRAQLRKTNSRLSLVG